jgi:hypothetical protein
MTGAETFWLNLTNVALGVMTVVLCIATLAVIAVEVRLRLLGRLGGPSSPQPRRRLQRANPTVTPPLRPLPTQRFAAGDDIDPADDAWPGSVPAPRPPRPGQPRAWLN